MFCLIFQHIIIWCFCWYCCEDSLSVLLHSCQTKSISVSRFLFSYFMSSFSFLAASWGKEWFPCVIIKVVRFRGYTVSTCVVRVPYMALYLAGPWNWGTAVFGLPDAEPSCCCHDIKDQVEGARLFKEWYVQIKWKQSFAYQTSFQVSAIREKNISHHRCCLRVM